MKRKTRSSIIIRDELFERYPKLLVCRDSFDSVYSQMLCCCRSGGRLLLAGNGGSAADSDHMAGELIKSFLFSRALEPSFESKLKELYGSEGEEIARHLEGGIPAVSLVSMSALRTSYANDVNERFVFAQLVHVLGSCGDLFFGISTSGNSENILSAMMAAKAKKMITIGLTGHTGGRCMSVCDVCICVPEEETFKVQELHLPVYHALCAMLEADLFEERYI